MNKKPIMPDLPPQPCVNQALLVWGMMSVPATVFVLLLLVVTAGCATTSDTRQTVAEMCIGYGHSMKALAVAREKDELSPEQVFTVDEIILIVGPVCEDQSIIIDPAALDRLRTQITRLASLAAGAK